MGQNITELANEEFIQLGWASGVKARGDNGMLSHSLRAVFQAYLGLCDANPATLDPLPHSETAQRYVEAMGGGEAVPDAGRAEYEGGDYQSVVEPVNNAVFANPESEPARALQADALEELGYQAESATWRNAYPISAQELRQGPVELGASTLNADTLREMPNELLFDFITLSVDHEMTDGIDSSIPIEFTEFCESWALEFPNSVLNSIEARVLENRDVTLTLTRQAFLALMRTPLTELAQSGQVQREGDPSNSPNSRVPQSSSSRPSSSSRRRKVNHTGRLAGS